MTILGDTDLHLFGEGTHERIHEKLGAHVGISDGAAGVHFAVWAPNARSVGVVGDFNGWDPRAHPMRCLGDSGVWARFVEGVRPGALYKYAVETPSGEVLWKTDPFALCTEAPPRTTCVVQGPTPRTADVPAARRRDGPPPHKRPLSIYEVHLGSWRRVVEEGDRPLGYREIAPLLADYVHEMGFTHVELLPIMEHPFGGSWGYQVGAYFAPSRRYGDPDDFRFLVDTLHDRGIGVILDWVPAHFPRDEWGLGRFDGTALYEHLDSREGIQPDWGTYVFNYGRREVRSFLLSNAFHWLDGFGVDGLRLDAVASMLYRDYSRPPGGWIPNRFGGRENLEAILFLRDLNERIHARFPGVLMIAEESTAWPGVSRPTHSGGLGFGFKWNMGWMHDTLAYFARDPVHRRHHHDLLTFGLLYAWSENFVLPLSHDEVVHGKGSLLGRMPGGEGQALANVRALYAHMWAHPGKKLLFMGGEFAQRREWDHDRSLDWHLLSQSGHRGVQRLVRDLNRLYRSEPALWEMDGEPEGFRWLDADDAGTNVIAYLRRSGTGGRVVCIGNFSGTLRAPYRVPLPCPGTYREILNTDAACYGGSNAGNLGIVNAEPVPWKGEPCSALVVLPPLSVLWLAAPG